MMSFTRSLIITSYILLLMCCIQVEAQDQFDPHADEKLSHIDGYGRLPFAEEKQHLDWLASVLKGDPSLTAYLVVYGGRKTCIGEAEGRVKRSTDYLRAEHGIEAKKIKWMKGGYREQGATEIFVQKDGGPDPTPSPTVDPAEIRMVKSCKSKSPSKKKLTSGRRTSNKALHPTRIQDTFHHLRSQRAGEGWRWASSYVGRKHTCNFFS